MDARGPGRRLSVETDLTALELGESIAVNGVCLTVSNIEAWGFAADVSVETVTCTTLGQAAVGACLNLERSLRLGDRMGGHWVTGHVDGLARVVGRTPAGEALAVELAAPGELQRFIAEKGSVCLDGVSLTVNQVRGPQFQVMLIPHTMNATNLAGIAVGRACNLEVDIVARYVARALEAGSPLSGTGRGSDPLEALGQIER